MSDSILGHPDVLKLIRETEGSLASLFNVSRPAPDLAVLPGVEVVESRHVPKYGGGRAYPDWRERMVRNLHRPPWSPIAAEPLLEVEPGPVVFLVDRDALRRATLLPSAPELPTWAEGDDVNRRAAFYSFGYFR